MASTLRLVDKVARSLVGGKSALSSLLAAGAPVATRGLHGGSVGGWLPKPCAVAAGGRGSRGYAGAFGPSSSGRVPLPGTRSLASAAAGKKDYYETLGINRDASDGEVKRAYLARAKELHPDTNDDPDALSQFQEVQRAYEVLKDKDKRRMYDQVGGERFENIENGSDPFGGAGGFHGGHPFGGQPFGQDFSTVEDIFSQFFGGMNMHRGQNVAVDVSISFEEAAFGCQKTIKVDIPHRHQGGVYSEPRTIELKIPAGVDDNSTLRVRGEGALGPQAQRKGDLLVQVRVRPHARFRREGADIRLEVGLSLMQAVLGGSVRIPTLDEGNINLRIRPGTQPGEMQVLRGKGVPYMGMRGRGNLYVRYKVRVPERITERQKALLEEFQQLEEFGDDGSNERATNS